MHSKTLRSINSAKFFMTIIGILSIIISTFYVSTFLALIGAGFIFWGIILFYITPVKHIPLTIVDYLMTSNNDNVERILLEFDLTNKGIYLPPKNLKNTESSLIFIPKKLDYSLPLADENTQKLYLSQKGGLLLTPPGFGLSQLLEKEFGVSFNRTDLKTLQMSLPKTLVEKLGIAQNIEICAKEKNIDMIITGNIFNAICEETNSQPRMHALVGCVMASALACVLAKVAGKPVTIQSETINKSLKTTSIKFLIMD